MISGRAGNEETRVIGWANPLKSEPIEYLPRAPIMNPEVILIQKPAVDFDLLLSLGHKMLGRSIIEDNGFQLSDSERFLECLAGLGGSEVSPHLFSHVSFSAMIVADDRDILEILQVAGMPFVSTDTVARGVVVAVLTGTLGCWRDAVVSGCDTRQPLPVRNCYSKVLVAFEQEGLRAWNDKDKQQQNDGTLILYDS